MDQKELVNKWTNDVKNALVGKTVKEVRYMTEKEKESMMWYNKPIVIIFDDGTAIYPSADDEGNDAGAIFTNIDKLPVIPVI